MYISTIDKKVLCQWSIYVILHEIQMHTPLKTGNEYDNVVNCCLCLYVDISLKVRGQLYSGCVRSSMLHGSET